MRFLFITLITTFFTGGIVAAEFSYRATGYVKIPSDEKLLLAMQEKILGDGIKKCGNCEFKSQRVVKLEPFQGNVLITFETLYDK